MFQFSNRIWKVKNAYVLVTELYENERIIQELAESFSVLSPNDFEGERTYVYHKMNYVEPYIDFYELKKQQIGKDDIESFFDEIEAKLAKQSRRKV